MITHQGTNPEGDLSHLWDWWDWKQRYCIAIV